MAGVVVLALAILAGPAANADQASDAKHRLDTQIGSLGDQVEGASADEARLLAQIDQAQARKRALDVQLASLDDRISVVQGQLDDAGSRLLVMQGQEQQAQDLLDEAHRQLTQARGELERQAIAAYTGQPEGSRFVKMVLHSGGPDDLARARTYAQAAAGSQTEAIAIRAHWRDQVSRLREGAGRAKEQALAQRNVVDATRSQLEGVRRSETVLRDQVAAEILQRDRTVAQVLARKREFTAQIASLRRQSDALAASLRARQPAPSPKVLAAAATHKGKLSSPIPGAPITSVFGPRVHPIFGDVRLHTGVDFGADTGTPIRAAADGVVFSAGPLGGYGNATVIDHGDSVATLYAHQSQILVTAGQHVTRGQVIGKVGCTGYCTGPHLHFEVRIAGTPVDPMPYLS